MESTKNFLQSILCELAAFAAASVAYSTTDISKEGIEEIWKDLSGPLRKQRNRRVSISQLKELSKEELHSLGFRDWDKDLICIPLWVYNYIADGEILICIDGKSFIKGTDPIDLDIRFGCIAYGFNLGEI